MFKLKCLSVSISLKHVVQLFVSGEKKTEILPINRVLTLFRCLVVNQYCRFIFAIHFNFK